MVNWKSILSWVIVGAILLAGVVLLGVFADRLLPQPPGFASEPTTTTMLQASPTAAFTLAAATQSPVQVKESPRPLSAEAQKTLPDLSAAPQYTIQLDIDYLAHKFTGKSQVNLTNMETVALDRLYFRLLPNGKSSFGDGSLRVSQALLNGEAVQPALSLKDTVLEVHLPAPLEPGAQTQVEFFFDGVVPLDFGGEATPEGYGIYNFSEGVMALAAWYPILAVYDEQGWNLDPISPIGDSVYSDIALYEVDVSVPQEVWVIATGVETERQVADGRAHLHFQSGPMRDFFLIASQRFQVVQKIVDGALVNSYYLEGNEDGGTAALDVAADALQVYNKQFGPYPFTEFDVVDTPMRNALGVEYPGIVLIADSLYKEIDDPNFFVAVAHEVAHQWWYAAVGNDVFDEPWLDEALTTYSSSLYYEFSLGPAYRDGLVEYWQGRFDLLSSDGLDDKVTENLSYFEGLNNPRVYAGIVYVKGALFFKALREKIGDAAFFAALQEYYRVYQYQIARGADLLALFEKHYGQSLEDFYQEWLYSAKP